MDNTTSSYETASSTLVSREVKRKRSGRARDKEIAAVMELIECIERDDAANKSEHVQRRFPDEATAERPPGHPPAHPPKQGSGAAPAGKDASPPEPQHWYKSREEAPKPPSTRPEAKKVDRLSVNGCDSDAVAGAPTTPRAVNLGAHDTKAFGSPKAQNEGEPKYPKASGGSKALSREEHKYPKASGTTKAPDSEGPTDPKAYGTPAQYWAEPRDPKAPRSTTAQNSEGPTYSTPKAQNEAEHEGKPHDVKLPYRSNAEKEGEAKKEIHDLKSSDVPKSDDKKPVEEKPVQKHVVSSPRVQPHAGEDRGAPDATLKDHPAKRER
ncbi:hypothetical protein HPB51_004567 [Rhipicephalus microplus]|uniref:Uncharacterized protein n=1 Tax=Rhipicephalus microplus TaxID=6941 RepID=A0A9J6ELV0_RHIMP|nr:hypothetical protein HPB51_004567 [Rhipicephalus microplus]